MFYHFGIFEFLYLFLTVYFSKSISKVLYTSHYFVRFHILRCSFTYVNSAARNSSSLYCSHLSLWSQNTSHYWVRFFLRCSFTYVNSATQKLSFLHLLVFFDLNPLKRCCYCFSRCLLFVCHKQLSYNTTPFLLCQHLISKYLFPTYFHQFILLCRLPICDGFASIASYGDLLQPT